MGNLVYIKHRAKINSIEQNNILGSRNKIYFKNQNQLNVSSDKKIFKKLFMINLFHLWILYMVQTCVSNPINCMKSVHNLTQCYQLLMVYAQENKMNITFPYGLKQMIIQSSN